MSTQPPAFGAPAPFGSPAPEPSAAPVDAPRSSSTRTAVIAVAAGVVALGVLGGGAALVLTSGGGDDVVAAVPPASAPAVEPSAEASTAPPAPLPTAVVNGRNVFVPLVEEGSGSAEGDAAATDAGTGASTGGATGGPTTAPTSLPPLVEYVPGPTVTVTVSGTVTTTVTSTPEPETTTVTAPPEEVTVPGFENLTVLVREETEDENGDPLLEPVYPATFTVDGVAYDVQPGSALFGPENRFRYNTYDAVEQELVFTYGSALFTVTVPVSAGP